MGSAQENSVDVALATLITAKELNGESRTSLVKAACEIILLERHGRLIPISSPPDFERLAELLGSNADANPELDRLITTLPMADVLNFDGKRLTGGNFSYTDHIIGANGLPIGMDRQLPALLVPVSREGAEALVTAGEKFRSAKESALIVARTDRLNVVKSSAQLVADGVLLRPYAGRFDDWFYHLVQEGTPETTLQFYSVLEGLPKRTYHPVGGLGGAETTPPIWFNLSDIFSEGAHDAVRRFRAENSGIGGNPFRAFAWRIIPFLKEGMPALRRGSEFVLSREVIARAMQNRRRFTPAPVAPLFRDPSRFLGMLRNEWLPVANVRELKAQIEDSLALPERSSEPATNEVFKHADALPVWEDAKQPEQPVPAPQQPSIPAAPEPQRPLIAPADSTTPAAQPEPKVARAELVRFHVAVFTPPINEAEEYVQKVVASEEQLASNARMLNRTRLYLRAFQTVHTSLEQVNAATEAARQVANELERLKATQVVLEQERNAALDSRAQLRSGLEHRLRNEHLARLKALTESSASL